MTTVHFTCSECDIKSVAVKVRSQRPDESMEYWLSEVRVAVGAAHFLRSPECDAETVEITNTES